MTARTRRENLRKLTSTGNVERATPPEVFTWLDAQFGFELDVASTHENAKCRRHFTREDNGLAQDWTGQTSFMNPPFGKSIGQWVRKARDTASASPTSCVVCVLPSRVDAEWWRSFVLQGDAPLGSWASSTFEPSQQVLVLHLATLRVHVWHFGERVAFDGLKSGAPFPTAVVVFSHRRFPRRPSRTGPASPLRPQFGLVW